MLLERLGLPKKCFEVVNMWALTPDGTSALVVGIISILVNAFGIWATVRKMSHTAERRGRNVYAEIGVNRLTIGIDDRLHPETRLQDRKMLGEAPEQYSIVASRPTPS